MPLRTFRSSQGAEWRVWNVVPGHRGEEERRAGYDRRSPEPVLRYRGAERRAQDERRSRPPALPQSGWLVFESGSERRRLMPIPPGWEIRSEADLERLCGRAKPVAPLPDAGAEDGEPPPG